MTVAWALGFPATVSLRTAMWLSPWENGLARGDQVGQALWGFAAGGLIGTEAVARAEPDGYTLGIASVSTHVANPAVNKALRYDPLKDFALVTQIASLPYVVAAHPSLPAHSVPQLAKLAQAKLQGI